MFFCKIIFHITKAFLIALEIGIGRFEFLVEGVILVDNVDKNGLPNGAT